LKKRFGQKLSNTNFTDKEKRYLFRQIGNKNLYLYMSIISICAATILFIYSTATGQYHTSVGIIGILILLSARANLKQHKDAKLLIKFYTNEESNRSNEIATQTPRRTDDMGRSLNVPS